MYVIPRTHDGQVVNITRVRCVAPTTLDFDAGDVEHRLGCTDAKGMIRRRWFGNRKGKRL